MSLRSLRSLREDQSFLRGWSDIREKKVGRKFGGFGKLYYLCTRNSKERVFGGVWRALSGEQVLTTRELLVSLFVEVSGSNGHYI